MRSAIWRLAICLACTLTGCAELSAAPATLIAPATLAAPACLVAQSPSEPLQPLWVQWDAFKRELLSVDGRVIDTGSETLHSTSEGQSYGLFFALVNNDKAAFQKLLDWTERNLAQGDLSQHLPAWWWGRKEDNSWGVLDPNSASDADIWIAYSLIEAGRLWQQPRYSELGRQQAHLILAKEVARIPGLGLSLLPAPSGFHPNVESWRLNPSYMPLQALRRLAAVTGDLAWIEVAETAQRVILASASHGFAPDWITYDVAKGFLPDKNSGADGSYNAIRVYLWAGMVAPADPFSIKLKTTLFPWIKVLREQGYVSEHVNTESGQRQGEGPVGFSYAALPLLMSMSQDELPRVFMQAYKDTLYTQPVVGYYNQVLMLFARAWAEGRYQFLRDGTLISVWNC